MTKDYFVWLKEMFVYFFSRYGYLFWVNLCLLKAGVSQFYTFLLSVVLITLIAWRDRQFIDEDGYNMIFSIESKILDKVSKIWKGFFDDDKAQIYNRYTKKWENKK